MLIVQAQTFYDELGALVKQLGKMETYLATTKQVGLLPETLRVQQKQFMVGHPCLYFHSHTGCISPPEKETFSSRVGRLNKNQK